MSCSAHIPQYRGGARGQVVTSGLGRIGRERARWWWRKNERRCTNINPIRVDVRLKLRSPVQIAFDINARELDNEIKICIIL